jgi:hypothetical protein
MDDTGESIIRCRAILLFYTINHENETLDPQHIQNRIHSLDGQCYILMRRSTNVNHTIYLCWATFDDPLSIPNFNNSHIFDIQPSFHPRAIDGTNNQYETEMICLTLASEIVINYQNSTESNEDDEYDPPAVRTNQAGTNSIPSSSRKNNPI